MPLSRESARWIIESNLKPLGKPPRVRGWGGWYYTLTFDLAVTGYDTNGANGGVDTQVWVGPAIQAIGGPSISGISTNTGRSASSGLTNSRTVTVTGTAAPNRTVTLTDNRTIAGSVTANNSGAWSVPNVTLTEGTNALTATATGGAGSFTATLDTTPPVVAITSRGGAVHAASQIVSGRVDVADAGTTVTVTEGSATLGRGMVGTNGQWSVTVTLAGLGSNTLTAKDTDLAGNTGVSAAVSYILPPAPFDFNGPGDAAVLWENSSSGLVTEWQTAAGVFDRSNNFGLAVSGWRLVGTGDFNGDGTSDILFQSNTGQVLYWQMAGGQVADMVSLGAATGGWTAVGTGDFNGDGTSDVLFQQSGTGLMLDWMVSKGTNSPGNGIAPVGAVQTDHGIAAAGSGWTFAGTGDFTGNGTSDILFVNTSGLVTEWIMRNGTYDHGTNVGDLVTGQSVVGIGDFNGDGTDDILLANAAGKVTDWQMLNGALSKAIAVGTLPTGFAVASVGDYNGDGTADILLRNAAGAVEYWGMHAGSITKTVTLGSATSDWQVVR